MSLPVILSETAVESFEAICEQILRRLGPASVKGFKRNTVKTLDLISSSPLAYKATSYDANIRCALIKKMSSVFYEIKSDRIEILFFWDNRQEPMSF